MRGRRLWGSLVVAQVLLALVVCRGAGRTPESGDGAERYALIVTGAPGSPEYAATYRRWRDGFAEVLRSRFGYPDAHVRLLSGDAGAGADRSTRENVRQALEDLRRRARPGDQVFVLLVGHGSAADDGRGAKFHLVGPDLTAAEWAALVKPIAARVVFVNAASGSFPFLAALAGPKRIVVTAADSPAQQYETRLPEFLLAAFEDPAADLDKNGRVSIWEAFVYASAGVRQAYARKGQLATERALLDDTGRGVGREAQAPGPDGSVATNVFLGFESPGQAAGGDAAVGELRSRRADLERGLEALKARKPDLQPEDYAKRLEALLLEIAGVERDIRNHAPGR